MRPPDRGGVADTNDGGPILRSAVPLIAALALATGTAAGAVIVVRTPDVSTAVADASAAAPHGSDAPAVAGAPAATVPPLVEALGPARPTRVAAPSVPHRTAWPRADEPLRAVGLPVGGRVDADDVIRAAHRFGMAVGTTLEPSDVARVAAEARRSLSPVMWVLGGDYGATIDEVDLLRAAARLRVGVGRSIGGTDVARIKEAASRYLAERGSRRVAPGLTYEHWTARMRGGPSQIHVLRWQLGDPRVRLRPETTSAWGRKETVPSLAAKRAGRGGVAVVNGGFWAAGDMPDGLFVSGGRMLSDPTIGKPWVRGPRGTFALLEDGYEVGRPEWSASLTVPGVGEVPIRGVNRPIGGNDIVVYTRTFGPLVDADAAVFLPGVSLVPSLQTTVPAQTVTSGRIEIPRRGVVVAANGSAAEALRRIAVGQEVSLRIATPSWAEAREALAGGPLLIRDAVPTSVAEWQSEGFGPRHNAVRHPRTVLGFTPEGEALLVVIDGRADSSVGATTAETGALMRSLGAWDAVMLDGGGSSHMVVRGRTVNRPSDGRPRPISTALVLYAK